MRLMIQYVLFTKMIHEMNLLAIRKGTPLSPLIIAISASLNIVSMAIDFLLVRIINGEKQITSTDLSGNLF